MTDTNIVIIKGRLTRKPEGTDTATGMHIANFTVASSKFKKKGQEKADTNFFSVVSFGKTAEFATQHLDKGVMVVVTGSLDISTYKDKEDKTVWTTKIIASNIDPMWEKKEETNEEDDF